MQPPPAALRDPGAGWGAGLVLVPTAADAQERGRDGWAGIPPGRLPPPGECRVWCDGRPEAVGWYEGAARSCSGGSTPTGTGAPTA